jgi:predicted negative regulator of RcsB-dependent stress response
MAAIKSLIAREAVHQLAKRKNWAAKNVGPMVVFCIVGVVAIFLISLFVSKKLAARKEARSTSTV